jgi:two-component system chemotaxis response regulator CheY
LAEEVHTTRPLEGWFLKNILVVDDTADCREPLARLLKISGYRPTTAVNGLDALAHLDTDQPDLILLDLMMPEMDGIAFLKQLRALDPWKSVPVIVLTALSNGPLVHEARELGVHGTLTKACFTPDQLLDTIEHIIPDNDCRNRN